MSIYDFKFVLKLHAVIRCLKDFGVRKQNKQLQMYAEIQLCLKVYTKTQMVSAYFEVPFSYSVLNLCID